MKKSKLIGGYAGKKCKNSTTNYAKESHKEFCKRCMSHNKMCPITKSNIPSTDCEL